MVKCIFRRWWCLLCTHSIHCVFDLFGFDNVHLCGFFRFIGRSPLRKKKSQMIFEIFPFFACSLTSQIFQLSLNKYHVPSNGDIVCFISWRSLHRTSSIEEQFLFIYFFVYSMHLYQVASFIGMARGFRGMNLNSFSLFNHLTIYIRFAHVVAPNLNASIWAVQCAPNRLSSKQTQIVE